MTHLPSSSSLSAPTTTTINTPAAATSPPPCTTDLTQPLIPSLPNDVSLQCLARLPLSHHRPLSLVSKSWRFTLRSPLLYSTRRALNLTQSLLYLNVRFPLDHPTFSAPSFKWLVLDPSIHRQLHVPSSSPILHQKPLISVHTTPSHAIGASIAVLGKKLYVIGGSVDGVPTPTVWILDAESREWESGPEMRVGREFAAAGVVEGKIYVMGGCVVNNWARSRNWAEVYDPLAGLWQPVPCPVQVKETVMHSSAVLDGKVYGMADRGGVVFDPGSGEWDTVSKRLDLGWRGRAAVVDGILYCYDYLGKIKGFDTGKDVWKELKGVEKGLPKFLRGATMANVDGRLVVVWEGNGNGKEMEVFCADIKIEKDDDGALLGSIVWSNVVAVVPMKSSLLHCLAVAL